MSQSKGLAFGWLVLVILAFGGCTAAHFLEREPGTDLSRIKPGAARIEIESVLGTPLREWPTTLQVRYCLYEYDAGSESEYGNASTMVYLGIVSLGLSELFFAVDKATNPAGRWIYEPRHNRTLLAVSYNAEDRAIGIFERVREFAVLPEDGRPPKPN